MIDDADAGLLKDANLMICPHVVLPLASQSLTHSLPLKLALIELLI